MARMLRPKAVVLPDAALVPEAGPKPGRRRFTHEVVSEQPYYPGDAPAGAPAEGLFAAGTKVLLLEHGGGALCRVQDRRGIPLATAFAGLRALC
jgi:hypothetical protein